MTEFDLFQSIVLLFMLQIYGNGKQTRSFQYISDLIDGLVALMGSNYTQPVNIGNPVEHTIEGNIWETLLFLRTTKKRLCLFH